MLRFEWDEEKGWSNRVKHGIHFEHAQEIWNDSHSIEFVDDLLLYPEERLVRIGLNPMKGILIVVFCEKDDGVIRLISARKATAWERKMYERRI